MKVTDDLNKLITEEWWMQEPVDMDYAVSGG
jgi:hypothetical protein